MSSLNPTSTRPAPDAPCPCGSGKNFGVCCEPVIARRAPAASAEQLMRARFTSHVIKDAPFLHHSYAGTTKKEFIAPDTVDATKWTRLEIHSHEAGKTPDMAYVDFTAYFDQGGQELAHHEKAEFSHSTGEWLYTRAIRLGPAPVRSSHPKVGRNDPCPCGSGKKYKHCCGQ